MATLQSAMEKYARKTANAAAKYNESKGRAAANYSAGVAKFLGSAPSGSVTSNYQAGIANAQYRGGDPAKWAEGYRRGMLGG